MRQCGSIRINSKGTPVDTPLVNLLAWNRDRVLSTAVKLLRLLRPVYQKFVDRSRC